MMRVVRVRVMLLILQTVLIITPVPMESDLDNPVPVITVLIQSSSNVSGFTCQHVARQHLLPFFQLLLLLHPLLLASPLHLLKSKLRKYKSQAKGKLPNSGRVLFSRMFDFRDIMTMLFCIEMSHMSHNITCHHIRSRLSTLSSIDVELVRPGRPANPANTKLVESIIKAKDWEYLFPQRHSSYTYTNFLKAVSKFPAVCHPDSPDRCRQVLATMFAHFTQETGGHNPSGSVPEWRQGLHYIEELGCDARDCGYSKNCAGGEWTAKAWPCGKTESGW